MTSTTAGSNGDRRAAALAQVATLYPPPLRVVEHPGRAEDLRATWLALPTVDNPRLLVGVSDPAAAATVIRRQMSGRRPRTRIASSGLALLARTGVLARLSGTTLGVAGPPDAPDLARRLGEILGTDEVHLTLPIGPARANRKPVVQVTDAAGRVLAYCKVGHDRLTTSLVTREAAALGAVEAAHPGFRAPRVLARFDWLDGTVLVLDALDIPRQRVTGAAARERLVDLVRRIAAISPAPATRWIDHPQRERLLDLAGQGHGRADDLLALVHALPDQTLLPTGAWHGDLNSGNLALGVDATVVWDWERFETDVPLGFDLLHHDLHHAITVAGTPPRQAAEELLQSAPAALAVLDVPEATAPVVAQTYLLTLAARYAADDQAGAGADLGQIGNWLLPVVRGKVEI